MFGATSHMMTEVCGGNNCVMMKVWYDATSHMMTEVGGGDSRTKKV